MALSSRRYYSVEYSLKDIQVQKMMTKQHCFFVSSFLFSAHSVLHSRPLAWLCHGGYDVGRLQPLFLKQGKTQKTFSEFTSVLGTCGESDRRPPTCVAVGQPYEETARIKEREEEEERWWCDDASLHDDANNIIHNKLLSIIIFPSFWIHTTSLWTGAGRKKDHPKSPRQPPQNYNGGGRERKRERKGE